MHGNYLILKLTILTVILFIFTSAAPLLNLSNPSFAEEKIMFPLNTNDGFAATFGEFRAGHIHSGIDMRTRRRTGFPVLAPSDGQIVNLYGDENGYGLMLTFKAANGLIYKFAHLSAFENDKFKLNGFVKKARAQANRRFNFDIDLSGENIKVRTGEIIAFSGDTGAGPPHLHFEICGPDGYKNPTDKPAKDFEIFNPFNFIGAETSADDTPVNIASILLIPQDENSMIEGKPMNAFFSFKKDEPNGSAPDLNIKALGRFKLLVRAFDENKIFEQNESKMGVYKIEFKELFSERPDGSFYSMTFDSMDYKSSRMPEIVYDMYYSNISGGNFYYKLFYESADLNAGAPRFIKSSAGGGIIEIKKGRKKIFELSACDHRGNVTKKIIEIEGAETAPLKTQTESQSGVTLKPEIKKPRKNNAKKTAKKEAAGPADPRISVEYLQNVILFKLKKTPRGGNARIFHGASPLKMFEHDGFQCFYSGYEKIAAAPEITVTSADGKSHKKYSLNLFKVTAGEAVRIYSDSLWSIRINPSAPAGEAFYAGEAVLYPAASFGPAKNRSAFGEIFFSRPVSGAKIYYDISEDAGINSKYGIYDVYSKKNMFLGSSVEEISGRRYICASMKNFKRLKCTVLKDEKPPVLKISKKSAARISKPFKFSDKTETDFLSFNLFDPETGINKTEIKFFIDGSESGNYEYFSSSLLNCYLYDLKTGSNLTPGTHKLKITAADNSGNVSLYEKQFKIVR